MSSSELVSSWGNVIRAEHTVFRLHHRHAQFPDLPAGMTVLPYGNGRSYGDSCLNVGAGLLKMRSLDRFIAFDRQRGIVTCESGVLLADILRLSVPEGWFMPVTPGTRFVTVGGAIANDVHGKNHHRAGTFGCHVRRFELLRSDGTRLICSESENPDWFRATVGGLGLTGVITWVEIQLRLIPGPWMRVETIRFANLEEFLTLSLESNRNFEYVVAWVDCLGRGGHVGRGILQRANHEFVGTAVGRRCPREFAVPPIAPVSLINSVSLRLLNTAYYYGHRSASGGRIRHYESFFYPLDAILHWNRLYGRRGLYQYQCVMPVHTGRYAIATLLEVIGRSGLGSFLAVLKLFGGRRSPGLLSFPHEGITLALDFPNRGRRLRHLFHELDAVVKGVGGRLYPAKDGAMAGELFRGGYPRWQEFSRYVDPRSSSSFWRRVTAGA